MSDQEFFEGLTPADAIAAVNDLVFFGAATVHVIDGKKTRIAPERLAPVPASSTFGRTDNP